MQTKQRTRQAKLNNYRGIYQQIWQSIRIHRKFNVLEIVPTITVKGADPEKIYTITNRYLRGLRRHGHIQKTGPSNSGALGQRQAYQLINDIVAAPIHCPVCDTRITQGKPCKKREEQTS